MKNLITILIPILFLATIRLEAAHVSIIPSYDEIQGGTTVDYDIRVSDVNVLEGFTLTFSFSDADFMNVTATPGDFLSSDPNDLQFFTEKPNPGQLYISCTLLNGQNGASGNGTLVHIHLTSKLISNTEGSPLSLSDVVLRNIYNQTIPSSTNNALIVIDCLAPTFNNNNAIPLADDAWYNESPVIPAANFVFYDNFNLHSVEQKIDNNSWQEITTGINGTTYPDPPAQYPLNCFSSLQEGAHTVNWRAYDDVGLHDTWSWAFKKDTEPPTGLLTLDYTHITTSGFTLVAGTLTDLTQGEEYYQFDEINDLGPDRERLEAESTFVVTGLQHNTPYTYRFRGSDGVTNNTPENQWNQNCNYTQWSVSITRYTSSVPPDANTVICDKDLSTWYNTPEFNFTSVGGFGDGANVAYYRYVWNREESYSWNDNEPIWDQSVSEDGTLALVANTDANNWYLHIKGFNGENAPNGAFDFGPFFYDGTNPVAINSLTARTADSQNETTLLAWNTPDNEVDNIRIFAQPFGIDGVGTYPLFNGSDPVSASIDQMTSMHWTEIGSTTGNAAEFLHNEATRNDWYYVIFTVDDAGNISEPSNMAHALSYWPGDVNNPADGLVNSNDIGLLAASWNANGLEEPHIYRNVGPTIDNARDSRPQPDAFINFEDLMIYSLNYGNTNYLLKKSISIMDTQPISVVLDEQHVNGCSNKIQICIDNIPEKMKGIEITFNARDPNQINNIRKGDLVNDDDFFIHSSNEKSYKITYSNLSQNMAEKGSIAIIDFERCPDITICSVEARDNNNRTLKTAISGSVLKALDDNISTKIYPNPFSDKTVFHVTTKTKGFLSMCIYNMHGQLVYQPANDHYSKGTHTFEWNGTDDFGSMIPNGIYFCTVRFNGHIINNRIILQR